MLPSFSEYCSNLLLENDHKYLYHGTNSDFLTFDLAHQGNNQLGTGIYFFDDLEPASHYGKRLLKIDRKRFNKIATSTTKTPKKLIDDCIKLNTSDWWENWAETKNEAIKQFLGSMTGRFVDDVQTLWFDLYKGDEQKFCDTVSKFYDGYYSKPGEDFNNGVFVIYNLEKLNANLE